MVQVDVFTGRAPPATLSDEQVLIEQGSKRTVPAAFLFALQSKIIGRITRSSMCVSVEIVRRFSR